MIIGVTGMFAAGKDTVADYLVEKGFIHYSLSDMIREEITRRGMEITRDKLIEIGNEMRTYLGHDVLAEKVLEKIEGISSTSNFVFSSIRHPLEVEKLKERDDFFLIEVRAPIRIRCVRLKKRGRENDPQTLKELKEKESIESQKSGAGQQLTNVISQAKYIVENDSSFKKLYRKLDKMLVDIRKKSKSNTREDPMQPNKEQLRVLRDERLDKVKYYMIIAKEVSSRSNCLSTKHGAIIVQNDQIVATGYNGAPRKVRDCLERGTCLRRELRIPSGQRYELCRTIHSEANAIINAARAGVSLLGGDLYLFSEKVWKDERKIINAHPCFICKKMIINAGLNNVYCMQENGKIKSYKVSKWIKEWEKGDMTDDMDIYDSKYGGMKKCC